MLSIVKCLLIALALALTLSACQSDAERIAAHMERGVAYEEAGDNAAAIIEYKNVLQVDPNDGAAHWRLAKTFMANRQIREGFWELRETVRLDPANDEARALLGQLLLQSRDFEEVLVQTDTLIEHGEELMVAYALRGQALDALKRPDQAVVAYRSAVEHSVDDTSPRYLLIHSLTMSGDREEAEAELEKLIEIDPGFESFSVYGGFLSLYPERVGEAEAAFLNAVTHSEGENVILAYRNAANFYIQRQRFEEAYAYLENAIASVDHPVELVYLLARLHIARGNDGEAEALIRQAAELDPTDAQPFLTLSGYLGRKGEMDEALKAAEKAFAIDPNRITAKLRVAELTVDIGYREDDKEMIAHGREMTEEVLLGAPTDPSALMVMAKIDLAEGNVDEAITGLRSAIALSPENAQAHFILGTALSMKGERSTARTELARALELDPGLVEARRILARVHAQLLEHEYAVEEGRRYLKKAKSDDPDTRILVAQSLVILGRIDEAMAELNKISEDQRNAEALYALGRVNLRQGRREEGRAFMTAALKEMPGNSEILRNLMRLDQLDGRLDESIARVQSAIENDPENADLQTLLGQAALIDGRTADAEASFRKAIEIDPSNGSGYKNLAQLFSQTGRLDEAVKTYEEAIEASPDDPRLHQFLALLYQLGGDEAKAIERYEAAIERYDSARTGDPYLASAKNNLAYIYAESGVELNRALDYAQDAKAALPDNPVISDTLGWVLYKRGIPSAAISYLKEAEANSRDDIDLAGTVRLHLAQAYEAEGDLDKAEEALQRALVGLDELGRGAQEGRGALVEPAWAADARAMLARLERGS